MTDLADLTDGLKRYVAVPGTFPTVFPSTTDEDLIGSLMDGFAEAQLDGFFLIPLFDMTDDGEVTPDLVHGQQALIILYASVRIIQTQLLNLKNEVKYEASGAIYDTKQSSNVLTSILKQMNERKKDVIDRLRTYSASSAFSMADQYFIKATGPMVPYGDIGLDRAYDYNNYGVW